MKGLLVLLCALFAFQATAQKDIRAGLKAGGNYFVGPNSSNDLGWSFGGFMNLPALPDLRVQVELQYIQFNKIEKGITFTVDSPPGHYVFFTEDHELRITESAFQLPVLLHYEISGGLYSEFGAYGALIIHKKGEFVESPPPTRYPLDIEIVNQADYDAIFGFGYDVNEHIGLNARFMYGFVEEDQLAGVGSVIRSD